MSDLDAIRDRISRAGQVAFGDTWRPALESVAPGRIEIIGGHLDYNGGPVLAAAIDKRILIRAAPNGTSTVRAVFADFDPDITHEIELKAVDDWRIETGAQSPADFLRGVLAALHGRGFSACNGLEMVVSGNLPHGVGISSSAALCVGLTLILADEGLGRQDLVLVAQEGENRTGSPCGTMDQSASVFGEIIRFDGASNDVSMLGADLSGFLFVVANSGVVRSLATSVYPTRVQESKEALAILQSREFGDMPWLAAIPLQDLPRALSTLSDRPDLAARVKHVVTETDRVGAAAAALDAKDWETFGEIMTAGGRSSSDDYGIGHSEVDGLTEAAFAHEAVLGARIMGGGEGGAALLLIREDGWESVREHLREGYYARRGYDVDEMLIPCTIAPGASVQRLA
jgi:galactokinase